MCWDRFHIASHMNKAIDQVRAQEARELQAKGPPSGPETFAVVPAQTC
jgi:transposase